MEEYFHSDDEIISWLNDFAARQTDFEDTLRLSEISIKLKARTRHVKLNSPEKCSDCKSIGQYPAPLGWKFYCHMKSIDLNNIQQDISTFYVDPETRPEWCPMEKMNKELEIMDPEKREQFDKVAEGLSVLFGAASAWKKEE